MLLFPSLSSGLSPSVLLSSLAPFLPSSHPFSAPFLSPCLPPPISSFCFLFPSHTLSPHHLTPTPNTIWIERTAKIVLIFLISVFAQLPLMLTSCNLLKVKSLSRVWLFCSLPGSSIHGIFQARVLEWAAISFSRRSSWPRDWTQVSRIVGRHFTIWATRESKINVIALLSWYFPSAACGVVSYVYVSYLPNSSLSSQRVGTLVHKILCPPKRPANVLCWIDVF